ncbi:hypothetical protein EYC80_003059 [Monilinia laxa]|uniref:AMP-activated protein kinase glycogen-binding domain-containing protein n=1 Tax=Monilinia laxa TaxID=61186 RepID=A0A5N6KDT6_MONLA|nr:hypothetical protein EYC80_003059 [Monilinia laxa]
MGSFVFKWEHPAEEVFVTGTFDNWSKSEKLERVGDVFKKDVQLANAGEKIYYKFVVDGNWVTDHTAPQENDASGNLNNVLTIDRIVKHTSATAGIMSGVAPTSTTSELAKNVPLEKEKGKEKSPLDQNGSSDLPGAFPETPAAVETGDFSVNPLPAADGAANPIKLAPGDKVPNPSSFTTNSITSGVHDDPELVAADKAKSKSEAEPTFGISPLPAFADAVNPIKVVPGEKLPESSDLTTNSITSGVYDDPELVAADKAKSKSEAEPTFGISPLPAFAGAVNPIKVAPGEKLPESSDLTTNSITSGVYDDPELVAAADKAKSKSEAEPTFGISPLPAFAGAVNPIKVAPGEKIPRPSDLTANTIHSAVRTDKESYENSGALGNAPVLPPVVTPQAERDLTGAGILDLPPITQNLIPESSLPLGEGGAGTLDANPTIQSTGPQSTTTILAAKVPLESTKVPEVVKESQKEAGFPPEASAVPSEVSEKSAVEKELKREISVAPTTSEGIAGQGTTKTEKGVTAGEAAAAVGAAAIAVGGAAYAAAATIPSKLPESITSIPSNLPESLTSKLPESVQQSINSINATGTEPVDQTTAKDTPEIVKESIVESGQSSEAAANQAAVLDKKAVEKELLSGVQPEISTAKDTPEIVKESIVESGQSPEAAANEEAVLDKKAFEKELLSEIKPETSTGEPAPKIVSAEVVEPSESAAPAAPVVTSGVASAEIPTTSAAVAPTVTSGVESTNVPKISEPAPTETKQINSRDVSPHTTLATDNPTTDNQTAPVVTSGLGSTTTPEQSNAAPATPVKDSAAVSSAKSSAESATPSSSQAADSAAADKKKKRTSFFGKLKAKFHKD